jgi:hypothetical protein
MSPKHLAPQTQFQHAQTFCLYWLEISSTCLGVDSQEIGCWFALLMACVLSLPPPLLPVTRHCAACLVMQTSPSAAMFTQSGGGLQQTELKVSTCWQLHAKSLCNEGCGCRDDVGVPKQAALSRNVLGAHIPNNTLHSTAALTVQFDHHRGMQAAAVVTSSRGVPKQAALSRNVLGAQLLAPLAERRALLQEATGAKCMCLRCRDEVRQGCWWCWCTEFNVSREVVTCGSSHHLRCNVIVVCSVSNLLHVPALPG